MTKMHKSVQALTIKGWHALKDEGPMSFVKKTSQFIYYRQFPKQKKKTYKDILFINGCTLPHPERYRVSHQREQLEASGLYNDAVFYNQLNQEMIKYYRGFIFFRCPITDTVEDFIKKARQENKVCFFDIDDLVIDQKYTDKIQYVKNMPALDKAHYDEGVNRMRQTLELCDYAITTTERLQTELKKYIKEVFINRNVASDEMIAKSEKALKSRRMSNDSKIVTLGYFSGSITHNEDFELILPSIKRLLEEYPKLHLKIGGILDVPTELNPYATRIHIIGFKDWRSMPQDMVTCDINLAPLANSIFNDAKSENKWTEAALVGVVTAASNIGAFKKVIKHNKTGILVNDNEWYSSLKELIDDKSKREKLGLAAKKEVLDHHTTVSSANDLAAFIRNKLKRNIAFILPSMDISGGINVVVKHAEILKRGGWDVTLIDAIDKKTLRKSLRQYEYRLDIPGVNVIIKSKTQIDAYFDTMVATLWSTVEHLKKYPNTTNRLFFVQNYETDFYPHGAGKPRFRANATYSDASGIRYITMSLWCQEWLKNKFGKNSRYCSNGIDIDLYPKRPRNFKKPKINILIEGDSSSDYKNTDEAFKVVQKLDPRKFHVSYLSYRKEPKDWYRVDQFYNRIPPEKVGEVYASCDILIKTSLLESFSYPPLEMMATGGIALVLLNDGNKEYLQDRENCLLYKQGDIEDAVSKIEELLKNQQLRNHLIKVGLQTAHNYQWDKIEKNVLALYE